MFDAAAATQLCRQAAGDDVASASDDELLVEVVGVLGALAALEARAAHLLGEIQVRGVTDRRFGLKTAKWVAAQAKVDVGPVRRRLRLGLRLRHLPAVDAAVADGSITADHAAVVAEAAANPRIGDQVAATHSYWVDQAAETSFVDWSHQLKQTVRLLDQDGGSDPDKDRDRERARFATFDEGLTRLTVDLVGIDALEVRRLVEAQADRLFHQLKREAERTTDLAVPSRATLLAMALVELVRRGSTVDRDTTTGPVVDVTLVIEATTPGLPNGLAGPTEGAVGELDHVDPTGATHAFDLSGSAGDRSGCDLVDLSGGATGLTGALDLSDLHPFDLTDRADGPGSRFDGFELSDPYRPLDRTGHAVANPLLDCCGPATTRDGDHVHPAVAELRCATRSSPP